MDIATNELLLASNIYISSHIPKVIDPEKREFRRKKLNRYMKHHSSIVTKMICFSDKISLCIEVGRKQKMVS